jgi:cytochrome b pre-mRNA-processing protein 3
MFSRLFKKDRRKEIARLHYDSLVRAARSPEFYGPDGVEDSVDGRFDMIVLHAVLLMRRLREAGEPGRDLAQSVFDVMFDDMDAALREMATGDLSVGKKIKIMGEAFYGRAKAYETPLSDGDQAALAEAIERNLFEESPLSANVCDRLAAYALQSADRLKEQGDESLLAGEAPHFARL